MNITIHRGSNQIGGGVTEYEQDGWKLFVDYGEQLPGAPPSGELEVEGLTCGDLAQSALLITHYHGDHIGRIDMIPEEVPIYIGKTSLDVVQKLEDKLSRAKSLPDVAEHATCVHQRLLKAHTFMPREVIVFGPFKIMPFTVDHSAFDAYAFKIEAGGVSVFHTGDFRTHGPRSGKFDEAIAKYVGEVNYVVCEATNVMRHQVACQSEYDLQMAFERQFRQHKINLVYVSSTNIDRLFSLYHAAKRANRKFYVDTYQKSVMDAVVDSKGVWSKSPMYQYESEEPVELMRTGDEFTYTDKFDHFLRSCGGVFAVRATPRFNHLIAKLPHEQLQIYLSMWKGYVKKGPAYHDNLALAVGLDYIYAHTSGHCDMESLDHLLCMLNPHVVIPIHTDAPDEFEKLFGVKYNVKRLRDGETFTTSL
jgi:ribonuclease J